MSVSHRSKYLSDAPYGRSIRRLLPQAWREQALLVRHTDGSEVVEKHRLERPIHRQKRAAGISAQLQRQTVDQRALDDAPCGPRNHPLVNSAGTPIPRNSRVFAVSGQQLVASLARQDDLDVLPRKRRHEVQGHARRVRERFVLVPNQFWQGREEIAIVDNYLVGLGSDRPGDIARVVELAERPLLERHGKRLQRSIDLSGHDGGDRAAVQTAREEHSERHVGHQAQTDRFFQQLAKSRDRVRRVRHAGMVRTRPPRVGVLVTRDIPVLHR